MKMDKTYSQGLTFQSKMCCTQSDAFFKYTHHFYFLKKPIRDECVCCKHSDTDAMF